MPNKSTCKFLQLGASDIECFEAMMTVFGEAFGAVDQYCNHRPSRSYIANLLTDQYFIAIAAIEQGKVVGGLTAYELKKFEQERSEIYIYDLAVALPYRRQGIATQLIASLQPIAASRGAHVIFVQADYEDPPAIALYETLGVREEVLHFDISVSRSILD